MTSSTPPTLARNLVDYAGTEATIWIHAVEAQANRILGEHSNSFDRQVDAYLLLLASRNVYRAGEMALREIDPQKQPRAYHDISNCMKAFEKANIARDAIEHFDEYAAGKGRRQQPSVRRRERDDDLAMQHWVFYSASERRYQLHVVINGIDYAVDVDEIRDAAHDLLMALAWARRDNTLE